MKKSILFAKFGISVERPRVWLETRYTAPHTIDDMLEFFPHGLANRVAAIYAGLATLVGALFHIPIFRLH